jgi:hypothetical protein
MNRPAVAPGQLAPLLSTPMPYVPFTRIVEIIYDSNDPRRPWVAVDYRTRAPVLRLADRDQLLEICARFDWRIRPYPEGPVGAVAT